MEKLAAEDIAAIYKRYRHNADLAADFQAYFGLPLDEEALNQSHQIIIVAAGLDASTERIVAYLSERDIAINVLCFTGVPAGRATTDQPLLAARPCGNPGQCQQHPQRWPERAVEW